MERWPLEIRFKLGPIPVAVEPTFWLAALLLSGLRDSAAAILSWVAVVFVSVLVHELGHALLALRAGAGASIRLYAFGGLTYPSKSLGRAGDALMALAGPFAGFGLGLLVLLIDRYAAPSQPLAAVAVRQLMWVNFGWGLINLLPVLPLDGGHVLLNALGPKRHKAALIAGGVLGLGVAALAGVLGQLYVAVLFGLLSARNLQLGLASPGSAEVAPSQAEALGQGWQALSRGEEEPARRMATLLLRASNDPEARNRARDLLAWCALSRGESREALRALESSEPPESARALTWAMVLDAIGERAQALPYALRALEVEPSETAARLALKLLIDAEDLERAAALAESFAWPKPAARQSALAEVALAQGDFARASEGYAIAFAQGGHAGDAYNAACCHARAGDPQTAVEWIKKALAAGYDDLEQLAADPDLAEVRADPEIAARLRRPG